MGGAVRIGDTVSRDPGPWTPTVHRLLEHLRRQGLRSVPEPVGRDARGRDRVSFLPGLVPHYPLPHWVWGDDVLESAAHLLCELHEATVGFESRDAVWQLPTHEPAEVVCHNDFAPYNLVFSERRLTGIIDWDTASPGPRAWDVAYLAYRLVPLTHPANPDALRGPLAERARRLALLSDTYGPLVTPTDILPAAIARLEDLAAFTDRRFRSGNAALLGHADLYRRDARWIDAHADDLAGAHR